jgi:hypothetical protein
MSLKFEIKDWRFEITWSGMLCTPPDENVKARQRPVDRGTAIKSAYYRPPPTTMQYQRTINHLTHSIKGEEKK